MPLTSKPEECPKCRSDKLVSAGKSGSKQQRWLCKSCKWHGTGRANGNRGHVEFEILKGINADLPKSNVYLITYAQNDTGVHKGFLENLEAYAKFRRASIVVIPGLYRNPSLPIPPRYEPSWDASVRKYLFAGRSDLGPVAVLGDLRIQPTAVTPLVGHESISGHRSAIIAHPKLALKTIAEPQSRLPKILTTTGAVTKQNYSHTRAGKIGEFHHTIGACLLEVEGDEYHIRQINAIRDGSFIDLEWQVSQGEIKAAPPAELLHLGDVHAWFVDQAVKQATFGKRGIVETLAPKRIVFNDTFDAFSISHHHRKDPFLRALKSDTGLNLVAREMKDTIDFVFEVTPPGVEAVIVPSNHDEHLMRWLKENDWREDPDNSEFYLETALYVRRNVKMVGGVPELPDPFQYWFRKDPRCRKNFVLLNRGEEYTVKNVDVSNHGDLGANGSRGSIRQYARMGSKTISGHTHTFGIDEGAYSSGTSSNRKRGFNQGLSTWMNGHTILYANGKRSLLIIINGKYRL